MTYTFVIRRPWRSKPCLNLPYLSFLYSSYYTACLVSSCLMSSCLVLGLPHLAISQLLLPQTCLASGCLDSFCLALPFTVSMKEFWLSDRTWNSSVESCRWLAIVSSCLSTASEVADSLLKSKTVVLKGNGLNLVVHGWSFESGCICLKLEFYPTSSVFNFTGVFVQNCEGLHIP